MLKGKKVITCIVVVLFLIFSLCICVFSGGSQGKDDKKSGNGAPVSGDNWPDWVPEIIPVYQHGRVIASAEMDDEDGGALIFGKIQMDQDPYNSYKKDLLDKEWELIDEGEFEHTRYLNMKHGDYMLLYTLSTGGGGVSIHYGKEDEGNGQASNHEQEPAYSIREGIPEEYPYAFCPIYPNSDIGAGSVLELGDEKMFNISLYSEDSIEDVFEFYSKHKNVTDTHKKDKDDYLVAFGQRDDKTRGTISISKPVSSMVSKGYQTYVIHKITVKK